MCNPTIVYKTQKWRNVRLGNLMSGAFLRLCKYDQRRFIQENYLTPHVGLQSLASLMETREGLIRLVRQEASVDVLSQDPLLLLHEGLVGGGLAHVSLALLLLLEGLHPLLLCGLGRILGVIV